MATKDPRVDAYIARAAPFARPILTALRNAMHAACPDVVETIKWSVPAYEHRGVMCGLAAFKNHVKLGFWKAQVLADRGFPEVMSDEPGGLDHLTSVDDLPAAPRLAAIIKGAAALNEDGVTTKRRSTPKPPIKPPAYFLAAIKKSRKAMATYDAFSPSNKREYVEWVTGAKSEETRDRRLAHAVAWMAEGKSRNWQYER